MADALAVIGIVGSIASIIDILGKTIAAIRKIQSEWQEADLTFLCLASEVVALRAALTKIKEWAELDDTEAHHQLTMDLETSLSCCRILVSKLDNELSRFHQTSEHTLDFSSKRKLVLGRQDIEAIEKLIQRQTIALNLLLTACNWYSPLTISPFPD